MAKLKTSKKAPMKLSPAQASKIRTKAKSMLRSENVKPDPDSAAGTAT